MDGFNFDAWNAEMMQPKEEDAKRALGDMRKIEDRQANRTYRLKTDGKGEIIGVKRQETEVDHAD